MIAEAFLLAAMSLPPTSFHQDVLTLGEVRVIREIVSEREQVIRPRLIAMGVPISWSLHLGAAFRAWRIDHNFKKTNRDIIASFVRLPIRHDTIHVFIYGFAEGYSHWGAMRSLTEALWTIAPGGFFLFYAAKCPRFATYLVDFGFRKVSYVWHGMEVWEKVPRLRREMSVIRSAA